jgi:hypothetical protein
MIGQDAYGDSVEWPTFLNDTIGLPQVVNLIHKQAARSIGENDRKEEGAPVELRSSVLRHTSLYHP